MTTLYKPVLIESADLPIDEFPEGTIATHPDHWPVERCSCSRWESEGPDRYDPDMVGWTALVPIEAEEEWIAPGPEPDTLQYEVALNERVIPGRRLVTPWESV